MKRSWVMVVTLFLLTISVAYNAIWVVASPAVMEMSCTSRTAIVQFQAMTDQERGDWLDAAHGFAYLVRHTSPQSAASCTSTDLNKGGLMLPLVALAYGHRSNSAAEHGQELERLRTRELYELNIERFRSELNTETLARSSRR